MSNSKNVDVKNLVRSSLFLALALVAQIIGKNATQAISQIFVGSIINTILLLAAFTCGKWWGAGVGILTPVLALLVGQLNPAFAPFIPFIMAGNVILVLIFGYLNELNAWGKYLGVVLGAVCKFLFLFLCASQLFKNLKPEKMATLLAKAMGTPQLITALIGGVIALALIEILKKRKQI